MIRTGHTLAVYAAALGASLIPCAALAQAFPARAVRVIVPFTAGSAVDAGARITGQRLSEMWNSRLLSTTVSAPI